MPNITALITYLCIFSIEMNGYACLYAVNQMPNYFSFLRLVLFDTYLISLSNYTFSDVQRPAKGWFDCSCLKPKNEKKPQHLKFYAPQNIRSVLWDTDLSVTWIIQGSEDYFFLVFEYVGNEKLSIHLILKLEDTNSLCIGQDLRAC